MTRKAQDGEAISGLTRPAYTNHTIKQRMTRHYREAQRQTAIYHNRQAALRNRAEWEARCEEAANRK